VLKYSQSGKVGAARGFKWKVGSVTKEGWFVKAQATQLCFVQSSRVGLTGAYFSFCISKTLSRRPSIPTLAQLKAPPRAAGFYCAITLEQGAALQMRRQRALGAD